MTFVLGSIGGRAASVPSATSPGASWPAAVPSSLASVSEPPSLEVPAGVPLLDEHAETMAASNGPMTRMEARESMPVTLLRPT
jgi:hypothetical protein